MAIRVKRAYDAPERNDGYRILVDRLWPRGIRKEDAGIDAWMKELAPSTDLRKWFDHDPDKWDEFRRRYFRELEKKDEAMDQIIDRLADGRVTLVFGASDTDHNNAVALKEYLERRVGA
ncbi:MAG: DUF488 domain-containing protein [Myxococcota bacterium]